MSSKSATSSLAALTLGALGVVYGDIGASPLYALREVFAAIVAAVLRFGSSSALATACGIAVTATMVAPWREKVFANAPQRSVGCRLPNRVVELGTKVQL